MTPSSPRHLSTILPFSHILLETQGRRTKSFPPLLLPARHRRLGRSSRLQLHQHLPRIPIRLRHQPPHRRPRRHPRPPDQLHPRRPHPPHRLLPRCPRPDRQPRHHRAPRRIPPNPARRPQQAWHPRRNGAEYSLRNQFSRCQME